MPERFLPNPAEGDGLPGPVFEPVLVMLLSCQEQEAANDIGVTSFMVSLINGGGEGMTDSQGAQSQHAKKEKYPFLQRFQFFSRSTWEPAAKPPSAVPGRERVWDLGMTHPL